MKHLAAVIPLLCLTFACCAQEFSLVDDKGKTNGPFVLKAGAEVAIGSSKAVITSVGTQKMERMLTRRYSVAPDLIERALRVARDVANASASTTNRAADSSDEDYLKKLFADLGVTWPAGSSVKYLPIFGKLVVFNTPENLEIFGRTTDEKYPPPRQFQIAVQFVAFDLTNINQLVTSGPGISTASLTALWTNGHGELLAAPTVVTKAGQEAIVKGVTEVIYPTIFSCLDAGSTNLPHVNTTSTPNVVEPGGFQTRETGAILQLVPELSPDGQMISLTLSPQLVEDPVWEDYGPTVRDTQGKDFHLPMKQPFFQVYLTSTSMSVYPGHRILAGGGMPSRDRKRAVYLFVTATLVDPKGEAIPIHQDSEEPDQPAK